MSTIVAEKELPSELTPEQVVEAAYARELAEIASKLHRGLPCLIECDKDLTPFVFKNLRTRFRELSMDSKYLAGQATTDANGPMPVGVMGTMVNQLRDAVRGAVDKTDKQGRPIKTVIVLPHLDLLTTTQGGLTLTGEAREVIVLLYENPTIVVLGFKDPSFPVPKVIENLFAHRTPLLGINRDRLRHLITQRESRKFGRQFNPWSLYKYVSGVNAVRLRRLLSTLEGEDYPADPKQAFRQLRQATLTGTMEIPDVDFDRDIGGYARVKKQLRQEILDILGRRDKATSEDAVQRLEELLPRGMILWGPPGTGKTFFAKAIATAIGAAITIVSGPELKSKWVGESEENLRQIFYKARQSAPSIIVFDELDSFATARGTYSGTGVDHSMVNQLLTEMDGFHKEELVFVVGTTNFVESLDPALLRPGRFEFNLHIPYPEDEDRREILKIYDRKMNLRFAPKALDYAVDRTGDAFVTPQGTPFSGDHLQAMCRAVSRIRLREDRDGETTPDDVERGLSEYEDRLELSPAEEQLVAVHEAGHFLCAIACPEYPRPDRITIRSEIPWAGGYVRYEKDKSMRLGWSRQRFLDMLCVLMGGIEAERLLRSDVSTGAGGGPGSDLGRATKIAHAMVELFGMGGAATGLRVYRDDKGDREILSGAQAEALDKQIQALLNSAQKRAADLLTTHRADLEKLRDEVLEHKSIEKERIAAIIEEFRKERKQD
ncbi:MAG TPA: AAA family ATPase [Gemmataceae bacterium]|jgi:cell division protease FtsH|nr:AAA family ATPase [Gemmataceae bacterium]